MAKSSKRNQRKASMLNPGGESNYARKRTWLRRHAMWGFDVPHPKPWKRAT